MKALKSCHPVILISCAMALVSCSPTYRTNYTLNEPATSAGRLCSKNVIEMSNTCVQNCRQMARQCEEANSGFTTSIGFGSGGYVGSGIGYGVGSRAGAVDCRATQCEESCLAAARKAHVNCGGTVTEETVCTANCDKQ